MRGGMQNTEELLKQYGGRIRSCPLFHSGEDRGGKAQSSELHRDETRSGAAQADAALQAGLDYFHAKFKTYRKGECLKQPGDILKFFGLVLAGNVEVALDDPEGNHLVMAYVSAGESFGESLCYLEEPSSVSIGAVSDCEILCMDCRRMKQTGRTDCEAEQVFRNRFISLLAVRTLRMNDRIQILSRRSIREKLETFFLQQELAAKGRVFEIPMDREHLADYLGVNRAALSRELSRMKQEGLIDYYRGSFRLLR